MSEEIVNIIAPSGYTRIHIGHPLDVVERVDKRTVERAQSEYDKLREDRDSWRRVSEKLESENDHLKSEVERLKGLDKALEKSKETATSWFDKSSQLFHEKEQLEAEVEQLNKKHRECMVQFLEGQKREIEQARTIKELRERDIDLIKWCYDEFNHSVIASELSNEDAQSCLDDWIKECADD